MKNLLTICLIMATMFTINAQDGKPTKEQTVQFIKDYYQENRMHTGIGFYTDKNNQKTSYNKSVKNIVILFDENTDELTISFESIYLITIFTSSGSGEANEFSKTKYIIDLSKIEAINQTNYRMRKEDEMFQINLDFQATQGYKIEYFHISNNMSIESLVFPNSPEMKNTISIPVNFYLAENNFEHSTHNKKILQAFNHLRKLCGAPDPISFD